MKGDDKGMIVVTGGAGFIGSAVIRHLNEQGLSSIVVVDELGRSEKWKNLVGKKFIDFIPKKDLFDWLKGREPEIQAFIHLGACSSTVETDASYLLENNYRYTIRLAELARKNNQRFIYASSAATYGDGKKNFSDDHATLESYQPLNMYGYSKHLTDLWLKREGLLNFAVGLKYFNVFGPNEYHKGRMASAITHMMPTAKNEGLIKLFKSSDPENFGDGEQKRDFIYVKDAARMTCAFLENQVTGLFNVGSGVASSWNELARAVFESLEIPFNIHYIEMPPDLKGKYQNYTCADMKKTAAALGNAARCRPLNESVIEYVRNYLLLGSTW